VIKTHKFFLDNKPMNLINELEFVDGKIWANVYY